EAPARLSPTEAAAWLQTHGLAPLSPGDFAGSEGQFGVIVALTVSVEQRRTLRPHLVPFEDRSAALDFAAALAGEADRSGRLPANLKYLSPADLHSAHSVWEEEGRVPEDWRPASGGCVYFDFFSGEESDLGWAPDLAVHLERDLPRTAATVLAD